MESPRIQRNLPGLLLLLLCLTLLPTTAALECYSRNGVAASSSEFYNATLDGKLIGCGTNPTTCCFENQYCDVDLLCHDRKTGGISRQYCSDPDWPEDSCSSVCSHYSAAGIALTPCDKTGTKFCCGPSDDCCKNGNFTQINKRTGQVVAIGTSKVATSTTATPTSSSSSTAAPASATATTTDAGSSGGSGGGLTEQAKLGIGLGVGLGVPFLGAVAAALFFWRRTLLSQAQAQNKGGDADEMAKVASPGPGPGPGSGTGSASSPPSVPGYGQNAAAAVSGTGVAAGTAAATEPGVGTTGREAELGGNQLSKPVYQLEAETNTRSELEDGSGTRRLYELQ